MESLGKYLQQQREAQNFSLHDVEAATKIQKTYLEAIENDQYDRLPGKIYAKGFIKNYAKMLKIEQTQEFQSLLAQEFTQPLIQTEIVSVMEEPVAEGKKDAQKQTLWKKKMVFTAFALLVVLLGMDFFYQWMVGKTDTPQDENPPVSEVQKQDETKPSEEIMESELNQNADDTGKNETIPPKQEEEIQSLDMKISILDIKEDQVDKCWLSVSTDGSVLWEDTLTEGAEKIISAKKSIKLKAGNAGVVKIVLNGKELGIMGEASQVVTKEFTLESLQKKEEKIYTPSTESLPSGDIYEENPVDIDNTGVDR